MASHAPVCGRSPSPSQAPSASPRTVWTVWTGNWYAAGVGSPSCEGWQMCGAGSAPVGWGWETRVGVEDAVRGYTRGQ
ncbi:MAG: hypothetical protein ACRDHS_10830 [Actinomycetota bacterium]